MECPDCSRTNLSQRPCDSRNMRSGIVMYCKKHCLLSPSVVSFLTKFRDVGVEVTAYYLSAGKTQCCNIISCASKNSKSVTEPAEGHTHGIDPFPKYALSSIYICCVDLFEAAIFWACTLSTHWTRALFQRLARIRIQWHALLRKRCPKWGGRQCCLVDFLKRVYIVWSLSNRRISIRARLFCFRVIVTNQRLGHTSCTRVKLIAARRNCKLRSNSRITLAKFYWCYVVSLLPRPRLCQVVLVNT